MKYTPPDYQQLNKKQRELIDNLYAERDSLSETLRDRFAMACLTGIMACEATSNAFAGDSTELFTVGIARDSYEKAAAAVAVVYWLYRFDDTIDAILEIRDILKEKI